jgi:hypothetical protein
MREEVIDLINHGPLPSSRVATVEWLKRHEEIFNRIARPLTDEEACKLVALFGPDDCFGAAWALLHLIETAPSWPIHSCLTETDNEWIRRLRARAQIS